MEKNIYEIFYLEGLKQGKTKQESALNLAKLFDIPLPAAQTMIDAKQRVIKSGLTKDQAVKYFSVLSKVGLKVKIRQSNRKNLTDKIVSTNVVQSAQDNIPINSKVNYDYALTGNNAGQVKESAKGFESFKNWVSNIF